MNQFLILLFSFFLVLQAGFVAAASNEDINGTWFLSIDNDLLASSDDDYTSGIQAGWVSGYLASYSEGPVPQFLAERLDDFGLLNGSHRQRFISHSLSHRIFTPGDTQTSELIEGDIP